MGWGLLALASALLGLLCVLARDGLLAVAAAGRCCGLGARCILDFDALDA
ncbi:MAG: hypothetical protein OEV40_06190 [Acidimicrobiia bacterium]|nr:hypothetical protein [Acidimicrobiia bacterium]